MFCRLIRLLSHGAKIARVFAAITSTSDMALSSKIMKYLRDSTGHSARPHTTNGLVAPTLSILFFSSTFFFDVASISRTDPVDSIQLWQRFDK
jgi:hypothetical protein